MTQDQYGQSGGSGYGVSDDAVPSDDADDSQGKPMTRFQKVASALLGDRPERDETATDRTAADETAPRGDVPTNPDVPPAGTAWDSQPGDAATGATATPGSRDALNAQDRDALDDQYDDGSTVPDDTVSGGAVANGTRAGSTAADGTVTDSTGTGYPVGSGTPADANAQRDYWDEPAGSAAGTDPAALDRETAGTAAAQQDAYGDRPAAPTFTPASEAGAAEAGEQPGAATIADVPAAGASAADDGALAGRDAAGSPETAGSPLPPETAGSPMAAGSPAAEGAATAAGTTPAAGATTADVPGAGAPVTDAPVTDAPVAGAPVTDAPVTDAPVAGSAAAAGTGAETAAGGPAANDLRPGEAAGKLGDFSDLTFGSLIPDAAAYTDQWQQVQFRFVDDPRGSVTEAAEIVKQVTGKLENAIQERLQAIQQRQRAIQEQQKSLDSRWGEGSNADTETLRETLRMYKTFLDQLVGPKA
jgi:hypothetical protein